MALLVGNDMVNTGPCPGLPMYLNQDAAAQQIRLKISTITIF